MEKKKQSEIRRPRTYKVADKYYKKAMKIAKSNKISLSNILEATVINYSKGES